MEIIEALIYELSGPRNLYFKKERLAPTELLEDEIIAQTIYTAISPGTEVAAYTGLQPLRADISQYPRVSGYCNIAKVIHKGAAVSKFDVGDYFLNFQSHRSHFKCKESDFIIKVSKEHIKNSCVAYLYHLGFHSALTGALRAGHNVGIIGLGVLGYTAGIMSKISGANTFVLTNQLNNKETIENEGLQLFKKSESSIEAIKNITHQVGIDIVINTSNTWNDWLLSMQLVNKGGTIVNLGFPGRGEESPDFNPLDPKYLYMKNTTIKYLSALNSKSMEVHEQRFNIERNLFYILNLIEKGIIHSEQIISAEISYKDLEKQYHVYESRENQLFSTVLNWIE